MLALCCALPNCRTPLYPPTLLFCPLSCKVITFTNKAADELKERLAKMLGQPKKKLAVKAGTFHSICAGILRWA